MPATGPPRSPDFDGRRVRLSDLLQAGLLHPGQTLYYRQRRGEDPHESEVTGHGRLRLPDGREFDSPSGACRALSDVDTGHGWAAWRVEPDGESLDGLRATLLRRTAPPGAADHLALLGIAREKAAAGTPVSLSLRDLLGKWGATGLERDAIHRIDTDLTNAGLATEPDFRAVSPHHRLRLVLDRDDTPEPAQNARDIGLTLGYLIGTKPPLTSVSPAASLEKALTEMEINDFSQLPVLADPSTLHGVVSWKSIGRRLRPGRDTTPSLSDVVDAPARIFDYDVLLRDALEALRTDEFILVRDFERRIAGIITAADVVETYDRTTTPFILIGEVDQGLRQILRTTFDLETVQRACPDARIRSFDKLSMFHYEQVLRDPGCWAALGWGLDQQVVAERVRELREIRNRVMHFDADLVPANEVAKLRHFLTMLRRYTR
ncbi:CBS domain-containing protein [Actinoplanes sp. NBRC 101535]|uniref:restriction system modified-DNA reader domain-containing protein n=1 Tax=Actinoplanes sp. NBRC 101535 TaxID=3032196 RepID=UPI0024A10AEC|nr:CBS domain-containing protein [Actinoplanes sp. NBRC 101535]GLY00537.1 hypothetical protein Acsp01_09160 [Actinoplanes sp. NBRC 101535]